MQILLIWFERVIGVFGYLTFAALLWRLFRPQVYHVHHERFSKGDSGEDFFNYIRNR